MLTELPTPIVEPTSEPSATRLAEREEALTAGEAALAAGQLALSEKQAHQKVIEERLITEAQQAAANKEPTFKLRAGCKRLWAEPPPPPPPPPNQFALRLQPKQVAPRQPPPPQARPVPHAPAPAGQSATPRKGYQGRRAAEAVAARLA